MTRADDYHFEINSIIKSGDRDRITQIIETFYHRNDFTRWSFVSIEHQSDWGWAIKIHDYEHDCDIRISYDSDKNRWEWNNRRIADADMAENLGVPSSYLMGLADALHWSKEANSNAISSQRALDQATKLLSEKKAALDRRKERLEKREAAIAENADAFYIEKEVESRVRKKVRAFNRETGRKTAELISDMKAELLVSNQFRHQYKDWPGVPLPAVSPVRNGQKTDLPPRSGIYFVWRDGEVNYVGQSIRLNQRASLSHQRIEPGDKLSWVEVPRSELNYAECHYIALCRPPSNFGGPKEDVEESELANR